MSIGSAASAIDYSSECFEGVDPSGIYDWGDPEELQPCLPDVAELDLNIIPEPLCTWITDSTERLGTRPDFMTTATLVAVGSVIGCGAAIQPKRHDHEWKEVCNLWGLNVGQPSELKTPALSLALKPLKYLESLAEAEFKDALNWHEVKKISYEEEVKKTESDLKKQINTKNPKDKSVLIEQEQQNLFNLRQQEPDKPTKRRYKSNDSTIEQLGVLLEVNPRGLLIERDEFYGWISSFDKAGRESDRAAYLEFWNGTGSFSTDRVTRDAIHIKNACVSVFGNIQPARLEKYLKTMMHSENDGLIQRFGLAVYPDPTKWKLVDREPNKEIYNQVCTVFEKLSKCDFTELGGRQSESTDTVYFNFDDEAQERFYAWLEDLQTNKLNEDTGNIITQHLTKYRKLVPALSLIFHIVDCIKNGSSGRVSRDALERSIHYSEYLESHMQRIYTIVESIAKQRAIALSKKILAGKLDDKFKVRDITQKRWHLLVKNEHAEEAISELIESNWLIKLPYKPHTGRPTHKHLINPKILQEHLETNALKTLKSIDAKWDLYTAACEGTKTTPKQLADELKKDGHQDISNGELTLEGLKIVAKDLGCRTPT